MTNGLGILLMKPLYWGSFYFMWQMYVASCGYECFYLEKRNQKTDSPDYVDCDDPPVKKKIQKIWIFFMCVIGVQCLAVG